MQVRRIRLSETTLDDFRDADFDIDDLFRRQLEVKAQCQSRIRGRLQTAGAGVDLGADFHQPVAGAEIVRDFAGIVLAGEGVEETGFAFKNVARSGNTLAGQQCGDDAGFGATTAIDALDLRAGVIELRETAGIIAGGAQRTGKIRGIEVEQLADCQCGPQRTAGRRRHEAAMKQRGLCGNTNAQRGFVADDRSFEQRAAVAVFLFGNGQHRRQDRSAGVMHRSDMRVVQIAGMGVGAVDEGGARRIGKGAAEQNGRTAAATECECEFACRAAPRQARTDSDNPQQVEHQRLHAFDDFGRRLFEAELFCPRRQCGGGGGGARVAHMRFIRL